MEANRVESEVIIELRMTLTEATVLKAMMQNPISEDETQIDYDVRQQVWESLHEAGA